MRILLLAHGPSVHTRRWAKALRGRGHEIRLLTAVPTPSPEVPERVIGIPAPVPAIRYLGAVAAVREAVRTFFPDVVVAHFLPNYGLLAALSGARAWMVACWGSDLLVNARRSPFHRARARWVLGKAPLVHVDAKVLEDAAVSLGAPRERVWTRAWGVDVDAFRPKAPSAANGRPIRVLWTRQLEPVYDPEPFVRALGLVKRRGLPLRVTMAGDGPMRGRIERWIRDEDLVGDVTLEGFVSEEKLLELHRASDLYVSASRSDSTSQSLLEAMAAGLFPIVTDIAGNREWVTHRREGYLVPVGDEDALALAIEEAARDPERPAMAARARAKVVERGSFSETITLLEEKLRALAKGSA